MAKKKEFFFSLWYFLSVIISQFIGTINIELLSSVQNLDLRVLMPYTRLAIAQDSVLYNLDRETFTELTEILSDLKHITYNLSSVDSLVTVNTSLLDIFIVVKSLVRLGGYFTARIYTYSNGNSENQYRIFKSVG